MFDRFRYKFMQFMQGRYGADKFSQFLSGVILVLIILELIFRNPLLWWLSLILLIYMYFRMFSPQISGNLRKDPKQPFRLCLRKRDAFSLGTDAEFWLEASSECGGAKEKRRLPYLQMPAVRTENPYPKGKGQDHGPLPQMRQGI